MAYMIMLAEVETNLAECYGGGFCYLTMDLFGINEGGEVDESGNAIWSYNLKYFKELNSKNPGYKKIGYGWFNYFESGWEQRRKLLIECINETA